MKVYFMEPDLPLGANILDNCLVKAFLIQSIHVGNFDLHGKQIQKVLNCNNESQLKKPDISDAIFTLSLSIRIPNSQCVEGARDVMVL